MFSICYFNFIPQGERGLHFSIYNLLYPIYRHLFFMISLHLYFEGVPYFSFKYNHLQLHGMVYTLLYSFRLVILLEDDIYKILLILNTVMESCVPNDFCIVTVRPFTSGRRTVASLWIDFIPPLLSNWGRRSWSSYCLAESFLHGVYEDHCLYLWLDILGTSYPPLYILPYNTQISWNHTPCLYNQEC